MAYKVNSLEEMPNALSYLIESVEALQSKVNALQHKHPQPLRQSYKNHAW